jgi:hypothetical protein
LRLRTGFFFAAVILAVAVFTSYIFYAMGVSGSAYSYDARERAELLADIALNSFTVHSHSDGKKNFDQFLDLFSDSRAGGIKRLRILAPGTDAPYTRVILERESEGSRSGVSQDGLEIIEVTRPVVNARSCRECHAMEGDVLAFLSLEFHADGQAYRAYDLRGKLLQRGIVSVLALVIILGLLAILFKEREPGRRATKKRSKATPDKVQMPEPSHGGFGSLFNWLNAAGKTPDATSIRYMEKVEKMATIGELASAIAHEIKNPLAGISGAIQVLAEGLEADDPRKEVMDDVLGEIKRLDKTVRSLLAFARPPEPSFIRTPVEAIIELTVGLIKGQAKKQFVDVNILQSDGLAIVLADPDQMQQVFLNIMMNALHVMPEGGRLEISTREPAGKAVVEIRISDTGGGIEEADMENIFEPFYTTKTSGTGLGLAICRNIVESHGGQIDVMNSEDGAMFMFTLPLQEVSNV